MWLIIVNSFQLVLEQFDNVLSRKVNEVVNEIRRQRCSYLRYYLWFLNYAVITRYFTQLLNMFKLFCRLRLCQKGDPSGSSHCFLPLLPHIFLLLLTLVSVSAGDFFRSLLVEDKAPGGLSYVEFLVHVHRQIQSKMTWHDLLFCCNVLVGRNQGIDFCMWIYKKEATFFFVKHSYSTFVRILVFDFTKSVLV